VTDEVEKSNRSMTDKLIESEKEIASLKEALEAVRYDAMTDQLTGIGNRKRFDRAIDEAMVTLMHRRAVQPSWSATSIISRNSTTPMAIRPAIRCFAW
jgi:PleD family two-component response regulator